MNAKRTSRWRSNAGFTVLELLVALGLSSAFLVAVAQSYTQTIHVSVDQKIRTLTQLQAQGIVDLMVPEMRMLGNGVPFHQANFLIAQAGLTNNTVTQPILVAGTTDTQIQFRFNQTGEAYLLTQDFDPSMLPFVTLTSVDKVFVNDEIYITN